MVEIRVTVDDEMSVHGLMRRLAAIFGRSAISFDHSRKEVRVESEWESRAVMGVIDAVKTWVDEEDVTSAGLSIGAHSYLLASARTLRPDDDRPTA